MQKNIRNKKMTGSGLNTEKKTTVDHPFGIFNIELTNRCPMRCVMCPRTHSMTREQGFMEFTLFKKIIDELADVNVSFHNDKTVWLHHFGESLLHPEFDSFIKYAAGKSIRTGLSVNPMMLNEKTSIALLNSGLHILYLSLDGHNDESFSKIRGVENMYETSRSNMINFLNIKRNNPCSMRIILSMIDFSLNEESIAAVKDEWESNDQIDGFLMKNYTTWDGAVSEITAMAPDAEVNRSENNSEVTCMFPWENMTVTWDGDVVPCCFDYNKKLVLGNAFTHSLSYLWNDTPMQSLRGEFIGNNVVNPLCRNCKDLRG
jgi:radical SAM protein with 4Fe4S-binding SPASM domain